jgi:hypothetical protein
MVLDRLEHRGLVERRPHPGDRRRRLVTATPRGAVTATRLAAHVTALEERLMSAALTPAERARLTTLAGALYETAAALVIPDTRQRPGPLGWAVLGSPRRVCKNQAVTGLTTTLTGIPRADDGEPSEDPPEPGTRARARERVRC